MAQILCLSSQVAKGHVGNSAGVFTLERLGHDVMAVPTTFLSHHPGHGKPAARATEPAFLEEILVSLERRGWLATCDAVLTGYLAHAEQADVIARALGRMRKANPGLLYLCDPILGDEDTGLYVPDAIAAAMQPLADAADILTPNPFELAHLTGRNAATLEETRAAALALACPHVLATSAPCIEPGKTSTLLVTGTRAWRAVTPLHENVPKGTGDLMSALFLGHYLRERDGTKALARASHAAAHIIGASEGADELRLIENQHAVLAERPAYPAEELKP